VLGGDVESAAVLGIVVAGVVVLGVVVVAAVVGVVVGVVAEVTVASSFSFSPSSFLVLGVAVAAVDVVV